MNWTGNKHALQRQFVCPNFSKAMEFINSVALLAEVQNHHPEIHLHQYRKVTLTLTTTDAGKVTLKDLQLAEQIDRLWNQLEFEP